MSRDVMYLFLVSGKLRAPRSRAATASAPRGREKKWLPRARVTVNTKRVYLAGGKTMSGCITG